MKKIIALVLAMVMLATLFVACNETTDEDSTTTTTTTKKTTTLPDAPDDPIDEPEIPAEIPVTGDEWAAWHESMNTVTIISGTSTDISFFNADTEALPSLFDGLDGVLTTDWTKAAGTATAGCTVTLEVPADTSVVAYTFITGNDNSTYGRTPGEWKVYATNVNPETATETDWTEIDYVYDGATADVDFTPFGYTIDEDKVGGYQYYKFEFLFGITGSLSAFQLCELYLYTAPAAA